MPFETVLASLGKAYTHTRGVPRIWQGGGRTFSDLEISIARGVRWHAPLRMFFKCCNLCEMVIFGSDNFDFKKFQKLDLLFFI